MNLPLVLLLLVLLLAVWIFIRARRSGSTPSQGELVTAERKSSAYHAVSIKVGNQACEAAEKMVGRRFLSTAAPRLPLPGCDVLECGCRFVHHKDRRSGKDRRSPFSPAGYGAGTGSFQQELRTGKDRRANDEDNY